MQMIQYLEKHRDDTADITDVTRFEMRIPFSYKNKNHIQLKYTCFRKKEGKH